MLRFLSLRWLAPALAFLAPAALAAGLDLGLLPPPTPSAVKAELVAAETSIQPGRPFTVALRLVHEPHWHTYWINPGTGYATSLTWDLPPGWKAGDIQWPTPSKIIDAHGAITGNGYEGTVDLPVTLTPPADLAPGQSVTLKAKAGWLMCAAVCVPGTAELSLTLPVSRDDPAPDQAHGAAVAAAVAALPRSEQPWIVQATRSGRTVYLRLVLPLVQAVEEAPRAPWFFSDNDLVAYDKPQVFSREERAGGAQIAGFDVAESFLFLLPLSPSADAGITRLTGVLRTEGNWASHGPPLLGLKIDVPLAEAAGPAFSIVAAATTENTAEVSANGLPGTLLLAFFGGLILNLMPCVFPVLGIKILGFVHQAGAERRKVVRHGLVFTAGVLLSFWALAGALAVLRAGGEQLGWGFQLQSPAFVFGLAVVMLGFALNLSGVFEFGLAATATGGRLQTQQGYAGSFFTGVLATVVATPCSAPFLAPALGAALALPTGPSFLVFTTIALGLSTPYLVLSAFPGAVRRLPRPGAWMETFKQLMAFPLYATAGFLVWVLAGQTGADGLLNVIFGLTLVALAAWCYGHFTAPGSTRARTRWGFGLGAGLLAAGLWLGWPQPPAPDDIAWAPWSAEQAAQLHAAGRPVYIDFTARWCATCQANKKAVFASADVRRLFHDKNVAALEADWTGRDERIAQELAKWNRAAVPFNLVWLPGEPAPKPLPEVLTPGTVLDALGK